MGLRTFWTQLSAPKTEEIPLKQSLASQTILQTRTIVINQKEKTSRKRESWFGAQPVHSETIAQVAELDQQYIRRPQTAHLSYNHSNTDLSSNSVVDQPKRKTRRLSLSRKTSKQSLHDNYRALEALPPMPTLPASMKQTSAVSVQPSEKRRSQAPPLNRNNSDDSTTKTKQRKRLSFWESSNPDNSGDESIPPVPALVRDGSATPESRRSREHRRKDSGQDNNSAQMCEKAAPRRTYTPRNAAAGFLMSTSGASEATRKSFRKSYHIPDHDEVVCMTEEQQSEWEKLMSLQKPFAQELGRYDDSELDTRVKYSNKQALAALEYGTR